MGKQVLTNASVVIDSVDLSDHVHQVTLGLGADAVEMTAMGDTTHNFQPGLQNPSLSIEFFEDYASGKVDATLSSILAGGVAVSIVIKPVNTTVGATNPTYTADWMLESYDGPTGSVGQAAMCKSTWKAAGAVVRATS